MNKANEGSILYYVPMEELSFLHLFSMKTDINIVTNNQLMKHDLTILKWYDLLGFIIKGVNKNVYIVAKKYYEDKIRFKLWMDGQTVKVGGLVDKNGNFVELWKEYDYGNPLTLRKTDKEYNILKIPIVAHVLPLIDMLYMFDNVKDGSRVAYGVLNEEPTSVFAVRIRDTMRYYRDQQIHSFVTYYLYYDSSMSLYAIERRTSQEYYGEDSSTTIKIKSKRPKLKDKEAILLEHIEHNQ